MGASAVLSKRVALVVLVALALVTARLAWEASGPAQAQPTGSDVQQVRVTNVVDGDTVDVSPRVQGVDRVRLIGVDTPEVGDPCAQEATAFTGEQLANQQVTLEFDEEKIDRYDRALAYVFLRDELFNETLVREGYAEVATFPPNVKYEDRFITAQEEAQATGVNLWDPTGACAGDDPTPSPTNPTPETQPTPEGSTSPPPSTPTSPSPPPSPVNPSNLTPGGSQYGGDALFDSGGPRRGRVPAMPSGGCPRGFAEAGDGSCRR